MRNALLMRNSQRLDLRLYLTFKMDSLIMKEVNCFHTIMKLLMTLIWLVSVLQSVWNSKSLIKDHLRGISIKTKEELLRIRRLNRSKKKKRKMGKNHNSSLPQSKLSLKSLKHLRCNNRLRLNKKWGNLTSIMLSRPSIWIKLCWANLQANTIT